MSKENRDEKQEMRSKNQEARFKLVSIYELNGLKIDFKNIHLSTFPNFYNTIEKIWKSLTEINSQSPNSEIIILNSEILKFLHFYNFCRGYIFAQLDSNKIST